MVRLRGDRIKRLVLLTPLVTLLCGAPVASAGVGRQLRTITYHGYIVSVPRSWPVFNLAKARHTCVRFNRHALYLGVPGSEQQCPAQAVGHTEAILIEPTGARGAHTASDGIAAPPAAGSVTTFAVPSSRVEVTATWLANPQLVAAALHRQTLPTARAARLQPRLEPRSSGGGAVVASAASVYTGPGFDTCDAPSAQQMSAWTTHSPYHAIGIYIGGANAACPPGPGNPNLTSAWLSSEAAAGWHFIPTYVGLQAPGACGCSSINSSQASSEGTAAADDAVTQAQNLGLPAGTPIYDDMESYSRTQSNTAAVLAFLAAWTSELHAKGYLSGVYGNSDSAMADLVTQAGTSYPEPDDIWFAAWPGDGSQTTSDPNIPSADWGNHQRLHQYSGGHNETYGGVTLNIDGDYLDGATAGAVVGPTGPFPPPMLSVSPKGNGVQLTASWAGLGQTGWQVLAGTTPTALTTIASASLQGAQTVIAVPSAAPYFAVEALGSSGQVLSSSPAVTAPGRLELFGHSSFVGQLSEVGTIPVGCYLTSGCHIAATIIAGRTTVATAAPQAFRASGSGQLYYRLNRWGQRLLLRSHVSKLPVRVTISDASGATAHAKMALIPFATSGRGPARQLNPNSAVSAAGGTDFVTGGAGGIIARCGTVGACQITATLSYGRLKLATSRPTMIGGLQLGYVFYSLTARGRQMLKQAKGNQLAVNLTLRSGTSVATARLALVQF